ncbi:hypothetical protein KOR42_14830 [Thalassoglobus neptunius]|uniref:Uncharacterized protein n=1 Tax=Thalassoglobus neptunius TaxID=1938619 RepID=A0A5C5X8C1_9PLAN|nr:hypothetical protein KOR42_14830 [Thalassoglobus neptunius]
MSIVDRMFEDHLNELTCRVLEGDWFHSPSRGRISFEMLRWFTLEKGGAVSVDRSGGWVAEWRHNRDHGTAVHRLIDLDVSH